ncbi:hypothetical protein F4212_07215 [Candidatus Poribacteria bacterium]|nr:hypothetical protein [Candidatus Poribacteria bacterium]
MVAYYQESHNFKNFSITIPYPSVDIIPSDLSPPDWLKEDKTRKSTNKSSNPWKDFEFTDPLLENGIEVDETNITAPSSYDALRKEMIERYGGTTEVENYMQSWLKAVSNPQNMKYKAEFAKTVHQLVPTPETKKSMEIFKAIARFGIVIDNMLHLHKKMQDLKMSKDFLWVGRITQKHLESLERLIQNDLLNLKSLF